MFFSKNVLTIEKNQRILPKLLVFPLKKYQEKGGQSGKNSNIGGDLYDQGGSKNQGFHNGRNFGGHFLIEHPVCSFRLFFLPLLLLSCICPNLHKLFLKNF